MDDKEQNDEKGNLLPGEFKQWQDLDRRKETNRKGKSSDILTNKRGIAQMAFARYTFACAVFIIVYKHFWIEIYILRVYS